MLAHANKNAIVVVIAKMQKFFFCHFLSSTGRLQGRYHLPLVDH